MRARRGAVGAGAGTLIMQAPNLPPTDQKRLLAAGKCSKSGNEHTTKVKISGQDRELEIRFLIYNKTLMAYIPEFNNDPYCFVRMTP